MAWKPISEWPARSFEEAPEEQESQLSNTPVLPARASSSESIVDLDIYSSLRKVLRVTAWILGFTNNFSRKTLLDFHYSAIDVSRAQRYSITNFQIVVFLVEIASLRKKKSVVALK